MEAEVQAGRPRRQYSPEFKAEVIRACRQPGVSIRSVAVARGLNPSLVRHWLASRGTGAVLNAARPAQPPSTASTSGFLAVRTEGRQGAAAAAIRLEIRRGGAAIAVEWPLQEAASCGAWLREWLR